MDVCWRHQTEHLGGSIDIACGPSDLRSRRPRASPLKLEEREDRRRSLNRKVIIQVTAGPLAPCPCSFDGVKPMSPYTGDSSRSIVPSLLFICAKCKQWRPRETTMRCLVIFFCFLKRLFQTWKKGIEMESGFEEAR